MKGHCLFDLPVMALGATLGPYALLALVQHFQLPKWWAVVGAVPSFLLGGFLAFHICHLLIEVICAIVEPFEERARKKKARERTENNP